MKKYSKEFTEAVKHIVGGFNHGAVDKLMMCPIGSTRQIPREAEVQHAAERVLEDEVANFTSRKEAVEEVKELNKSLGKKTTIPNPGNLPEFLDKYSWTGGDLFFYDESVSLDEAVRACVKDAYVDLITGL